MPEINGILKLSVQTLSTIRPESNNRTSDHDINDNGVKKLLEPMNG